MEERLLANVVASQIESHKRFGGVVPEIASRHHVEQITIVIRGSLEAGWHDIDEMDAIAVTEGPGLVGALLNWCQCSESIGICTWNSLVGVHHIAGHIYANRLVTEMKFPLLVTCCFWRSYGACIYERAWSF